MNVNAVLKTVRDGNGGSLSKADEKALVQALVESFKGSGDNTYLSALFTDELAAWVDREIDSDLPPDLWGFMNRLQTNRDEQINERLRLAQDDVEMLRAEVRRLEANLDEANKNLDVAKRAAVELGESSAKFRDLYHERALDVAQQGMVLRRVERLTVDAWLADEHVDPAKLKAALQELNEAE